MSDGTEGNFTYLFNYSNLQDLFNRTKQMNESLLTAFEESEKFFDSIINSTKWKGRAKEEFQAFYHLVLQYHGQLAGKTVKAVGTVSTVQVEHEPCAMAIEALNKLLINLDSFTDNSQCYKNMESI